LFPKGSAGQKGDPGLIGPPGPPVRKIFYSILSSAENRIDIRLSPVGLKPTLHNCQSFVLNIQH